VWMCFNWLAMSNSCYNPFIYGLLNVSFFSPRQMLMSVSYLINAINVIFADLIQVPVQVHVSMYITAPSRLYPPHVNSVGILKFK
jgi:hypothetical protein